jgi:hypothetical protein
LLAPDARGSNWLVNTSNSAAASARMWPLLLDPATFDGD